MAVCMVVMIAVVVSVGVGAGRTGLLVRERDGSTRGFCFCVGGVSAGEAGGGEDAAGGGGGGAQCGEHG